MSSPIFESGMNFIVDNTFHIEQSDIYIKLKGSIKTVEFIRTIDDNLLFVEAKSSFPKPDNPSPDNPKNFKNQIDDIYDKFVHSLNLYASIVVGVNEQLPPDFKPPSKISLRFVLVFNN